MSPNPKRQKKTTKSEFHFASARKSVSCGRESSKGRLNTALGRLPPMGVACHFSCSQFARTRPSRAYGKKDVLEIFRLIDWLMVLPEALRVAFREQSKQMNKRKLCHT